MVDKIKEAEEIETKKVKSDNDADNKGGKSDNDEDNAEDDEDSEDEDKKETKKSKKEDDESEEDMKESLSVLFDGETLSEDFKNKAGTIFEAAVKLKVESLREQLDAEYVARLDEVKAEMVDQVDSYLSLVVSEWLEENKVAIETGKRVQVAESFMDSLKGLFVEHNIEIPEDKIDLYDEATKEVESLRSEVESLKEAVAEKETVILEKEKAAVFAEIAEGLADTQIEKFKTLAEDIVVSDVDAYKAKLAIIKESFFKSFKEETKEIVKEQNDIPSSKGAKYARYVSAPE